ncbi:hypothetical protein BH11MYX1_BH11MYX1_33270 [soil metagenome]
MVPILIKIKIMTTAMAGWTAAAVPAPMPAQAIATVVNAEVAAPVSVSFYDENEHQTGTIAIWRDGAVDDATKTVVKRLFRCRRTFRQKMMAQQTLAMLADVSDHYPGKVIEYVSAYRTGGAESSTSPHRAGTALDFRIRGVQLRDIRDYLWKTYSDVGVGWYPEEQFVHIDTRPQIHDTAWTFVKGNNHYHPYWAESAKREQATGIAVAPHQHRAGS